MVDHDSATIPVEEAERHLFDLLRTIFVEFVVSENPSLGGVDGDWGVRVLCRVVTHPGWFDRSSHQTDSKHKQEEAPNREHLDVSAFLFIASCGFVARGWSAHVSWST